jgi:hypothetical protein
MKNYYNFCLMIILFFLPSHLLLGQVSKNIKKSPIKYFDVTGNYRFYGQHRLMNNSYSLFSTTDQEVSLGRRAILIGDATQLPELTLNLSGKTTKGSSFGTDLVLWNQNTGAFDYYRGLQLGINIYGNFKVDQSEVTIRAGGIHWHEMTSFTLKSFAGFNRYSIWDRNPWDPQFKEITKRYQDYYINGSITQDARWAKQAVQGVILDFDHQPKGFHVNLFYGKSQFTGSRFLPVSDDNSGAAQTNFLQFYDNTIPNQIAGGRIIKKLGKHEFSLNSLNSISYADIATTDLISNYVQTGNLEINTSFFTLETEFGGSYYNSSSQKLGFGEMIFIKWYTAKNKFKIPLEIQGFYIAPEAINNNSEIVNTSVIETNSAAAVGTTTIASNGVLQQNGSAMLALGQLANNRKGLILNTQAKYKTLKIGLGISSAREISSSSSDLTFGHLINGLTTSRFWRWSFPTGVGPYGRTNVIYRAVFETVKLRPSAVHEDKYFNNMELQAKYKLNVFKQPYYLFYLGMFNSAQSSFSPVTVFTKSAYIRYYAHQLEGFLSLGKKIIFSQYLGWERVVGNYDTNLDEISGRPLNQQGFALGFGIDYSMARNTMLYLRHKYFSFEDTSFEKDQYAGHETTVELKIYF